jgi:catechol 2,3-dioxygenase-like lactoylglutathione lyase family enzyme
VFDHVTIRVTDRGESARFYDTVLRALDVERTGEGAGFVEWDELSLAEATDEKPVTRRLHVAFYAPSRELVDMFWQFGVDAGYRSDGEPGPRPQYSPSYYGGFLLDPTRDDGTVDAFHRAALDAGYRDNGTPGERPQYHAGYYGAFVLDPDGNNVEVVNHNR